MKTHAIPQTGVKHLRSLMSALAIALVISTASLGQAVKTESLKSAEVKHIVTPDNKLVFQVLFDNETGERFSVSIKDENGDVVYREIYKDKNFDKKFELSKLNDDRKITFIIRTLDNNLAQVFEINNTTRVFQDVVINKL